MALLTIRPGPTGTNEILFNSAIECLVLAMGPRIPVGAYALLSVLLLPMLVLSTLEEAFRWRPHLSGHV
jgi:hypothetical protein